MNITLLKVSQHEQVVQLACIEIDRLIRFCKGEAFLKQSDGIEVVIVLN